MIEKQITEQLNHAIPLQLYSLDLKQNIRGVGLVIVDEVNGFATVGAGNLAPTIANEQVSTMVKETVRLARFFSGKGMPILAFLDTHVPGKPEPPYPPHCESGSGEEELVPELKWLEKEPNTSLVRKDCINGFIGAYQADGTNAVVEWVQKYNVETVLVVGICTDICVMDLVLTLLSARNHGMLSEVEEILVYDQGCSTYNLPRETVESLELPLSACHPQDVTHYMGLYFMASRGAGLVNEIVI